MDNFVELFFRESENLSLYKQSISTGNQDSKELVKRKYRSFVFRICFLSYISKLISFSANEFRNNISRNSNRELLTLNVVTDGFEEEYINQIEDRPIDFEEEIFSSNKNASFNEMISNKQLLLAINKLTDKQKEIIYKCYFTGMSEKELVKHFAVSQQAINKLKNKALRQLRIELYG